MRSDFKNITGFQKPHSFGIVCSCRGSQATISLAEYAPLLRPTVGTFVLLRHAEGGSIGMISETSGGEIGAGSHALVAKVDLVAEITLGIDGDVRFRRGVRSYPANGDQVEVLGGEMWHVIHAAFAGHPMQIGQTNDQRDIEILIDADNLLSKHFAVLGSTGVGKSSGAAVILKRLMKARPDVRVLLLDVHNEYRACFGNAAKAIDAKSLKLPFWLFNFEEFVDVLYGGRPAISEELDILMELIPIAKNNYSNLRNAGDRAPLVRRHTRTAAYSVDTPTPYMIQDLVSLIDDRMGKLENRATRMVHHRLLSRIETIRNDPRYAFMFENANVGGDTMASVLLQLFGASSQSNAVTILELAAFPEEAVDALVCVVLRLAFELGLWREGGSPLLIVCEEAHRFASADHSGGFAPTRRGLSRIAKEGRKYGVHLGLISQRPAELDATVVSQCSSLFMMRMTNERDHHLLKSTVSDATLNLLSLIPSLGTGEVIAVGEAIPLPMRFSFEELPEDQLPRNERLQAVTPQSSAEYGAMIERAVDRWRRATSIAHVPYPESAPPFQPVPTTELSDHSALARGLNAALAADAGVTRKPV